MQLRRQCFSAPRNLCVIFLAPRCAISSRPTIASERRFSLRLKRAKLIPIAGDFAALSTQQALETGRILFRRARLQTPSSVSFLALTEFWGESSVSSPITCVSQQPHRVCSRTQGVLFSETVLSKQSSARFLKQQPRSSPMIGTQSSVLEVKKFIQCMFDHDKGQQSAISYHLHCII